MLSGKDGDGWVSCCGWAYENGADGGINRLKPFITTDTVTCENHKLGTAVDAVAGGSCMNPFLVSSPTSTPKSTIFHLSVCLRVLWEIFKATIIFKIF